jgi:nucleotide-binding universal stress UspA family protein
MLPTYQNILVATDFTPNSDHAFKYAMLMAKQHEAKIHLLHVVPQVDTSMRNYFSIIKGQDWMAEFEEKHAVEAHQEIKKALDEFAEKELANAPKDIELFAGSIVTIGSPVNSILKTADQLDADVIVTGTHSKGALEHALLGSVAEKVLHKSKRPIFVVPLPE